MQPSHVATNSAGDADQLADVGSFFRGSTVLIPVSLFAFTFVVYVCTFSPMATGDGQTWLLHAMSDDVTRMFRIEHLVHTFGLHLYLRLATPGVPLATADVFEMTRLAQWPFAVLAASGVVAFYFLTARLTGRTVTAVFASILLIFSSGYWLNANLENKAYTLFFWELTFLLCTWYRPGRYYRLALVGLSGAIGTLCQIDGIFLLLVVMYFVVTRNPGNPQRILKDATVATAVWLGVLIAALWAISSLMPSLRSWVFELSMGNFAAGLLTGPPDFRRFPRNLLTGMATTMVAGQSEAYASGYMLVKRIFLDRDFVPPDYARLFIYVSVMTLSAYYAVRAARLLRRERPRADRAIALGGLLVWCAGYHLLTWWNQPVLSDLRVVTLPPLLVLLAIGGADHLGTRRWSGKVLPAVFVALLAINTYWMAIHPARIYGISVSDCYRYLRQTASADQSLVVSEWSVPTPPQITDTVSTKQIATTNSDRPAADIISLVQQEIERRIADGRSTYVYALVPGIYTLRDMNRSRNPSDPLTTGQYETLEAVLMDRYRWQPVLSLVDARNQAGYQLGRRRETLWLIHP